MSSERAGAHESDYRNLIISVLLSRTIDGLLVSLESFIHALEEDSLRTSFDVAEELKFYLERGESSDLLAGIKKCWNSFEYLVLETPRFKLVRKYFHVIKGVVNERAPISASKDYECLSPPALWKKEAEIHMTYEGEATRSFSVRVRKERALSWVEVSVALSLLLAFAGVALRLLLG